MSVDWSVVDRLIDRLGPDLASAQGLGPLAARQFRRRQQPVPTHLAREERAASTANLIAPSLLARARAAYDGPLVLLKGPELAHRYPDHARRFGDLDLLAGDADAAQAALLANGFRLQDRTWPPADWDHMGRAHYHLHPLESPGLGLRVEVHRQVKWPPGLKPPSNEEIFEAAVSACVGVEGLLVPHPNHHAVLLASHAWAEVPMRKLRDIIDVMTFVGDSQREDLMRLARRWGFGRPWSTTLSVADWLLLGEREPFFVPFWGRYLRHFREPTVIEMHLQEWLSPFWLAPLPAALRRAGAAIARDFRPWPEQTWRDKTQQTIRAVLHPLSSKSEHDRRSGLSTPHAGEGVNGKSDS